MFGLASFWIVSVTLAAAVPNTCIDCHSRLPMESYFERKYEVWQRSRHGELRVGCHECHGGNPTASDKLDAHDGILRSSNPQSKVFYTNLPGTCGRCHQMELTAFKKSAHFQKLAVNLPGPSCNSCHWNMGSLVPERGRYQAVCSNCHNPTGLAAESRVEPLRVENIMLRLELIARGLKTIVPLNPEMARQIRRIDLRLENARKLWHTFNLPTLAALCEQATRELEELEAKVVGK